VNIAPPPRFSSENVDLKPPDPVRNHANEVRLLVATTATDAGAHRSPITAAAGVVFGTA
jgi:hypothetical protein